MERKGKNKTGNALFILNPHSGVQPVNFIVTKELERRKGSVTTVKSLSAEHTATIIKENIENYDAFVAAGGDGTVHSVATKLIGTEKAFAVMPLGSGNGFAREFGFSLNLGSLLREIDAGETTPIDIIEINNKTCLNVAGIGLDSFVAHSFNDLKFRGFFPYVWLTLKTFIILRPFRVNINLNDGNIISEEVFVLTIANTRQFGNNAFIAPAAKPDDGLIDLILIKPFPKIIAPLFILRLFTKRIDKSKYVKHITTPGDISIETDESRIHIDGEPYNIEGKVTVRIRRNALRVLKTKRNKFLSN